MTGRTGGEAYSEFLRAHDIGTNLLTHENNATKSILVLNTTFLLLYTYILSKTIIDLISRSE